MGTTLSTLLPATASSSATTSTTSTTTTSTTTPSEPSTAVALQKQHDREINAEMMTLVTPFLNKKTRATMAAASKTWRATQQPLWEYYLQVALEFRLDPATEIEIAGQGPFMTPSAFYRENDSTQLPVPTAVQYQRIGTTEERELLFARHHIYPQRTLTFKGNYNATIPTEGSAIILRDYIIALYAYSPQTNLYYELARESDELKCNSGKFSPQYDESTITVTTTTTTKTVSTHFVILYTA